MAIHPVAGLIACGLLVGSLQGQSAGSAAPSQLFEPIRSVLQHPRCQNCHIPGDQPLQLDQGRPHQQNIQRGPQGEGRSGLTCAACHQAANLPAFYGDHAPPGAPHWKLPPADNKMVFKDLSAHDLCLLLRDPAKNGKRNADELIHHFRDDSLVGWGWAPGGNRTPPPLNREQTVAAVKAWTAAGMPCPSS